MFTTCPSCALNLAVTAADLRVGQGYVRCGRCVSVFNALISLADEAEVGAELARVEDTAAATQSRPAPAGIDEAVGLDDGAEEVVPDLTALPESLAQPLPPEPHEPEGAPTRPEDLAEVTDESRDLGTGTFETIVLEGDTILQTEEFVDEAEVDEKIKALAEQLDDRHYAPGVDEDLEAALPRRAPAFIRESAGGYGETSGIAAATPADATVSELIAPRRRMSPLMIVSVALAVLLVVQIAHHWRYPLADRMPWIGTVYAGIGAPLAPQWQLAAYDVRQLGAVSDPANAQRIEVRASVRNGADRAQPAPVLRIILQDRFGNELGRHERAPAQYLPGGAGLEILAADQRVDASFWIDDPEQKAVGFELDACLRVAAGGALRCASDAAPK